MDTTTKDNRRATPYVSFQTFLTMIEDLKVNGLPPQIDRSAFKKFSGGVGTQLISAMKALDLMDNGSRPTERLGRLVEAHGTDEFKDILRQVIRDGYPFLSKIDLTTATPAMFADAFREATGAQEDVLRKCRTFYLHAAKHLGIEIGPRLASGVSMRRGPSGNKRKAKASRQPEVTPDAAATGHRAPPPPSADYQDKLLEKFPGFDPNWPKEAQMAWFAAFDKLLSMKKGEHS